MAAKVTRQQLLSIARGHAVKNSSKMRKEDLIHAIQLAEGNTDCFGRIPDCGIQDCMFRGECIG